MTSQIQSSEALAGKTYFQRIPPEIVLLIFESLDSGRDKNALARTCRANYQFLEHHLYRWAADYPSSPRDFSDIKPVLAWMAQRGSISGMQKLFRVGANPSDPGVAPLCIASRYRHEEMVRLLLEEYNVDPDIRPFGTGETALFEAVRGNHHGIVELLLAAGADPSGQPNSPLSPRLLNYAIIAGYYDMAARLIDAGAFVISEVPEEPNAISYAAGSADIWLVYKILDAMRAVSRMDIYLRRPLLAACRRGDIEMVRLLLYHGTSTEGHMWEGLTALELAVMGGHVEVVRTLLQYGISREAVVDVVDKGLFMEAMRERNTEIVQLLIANGAPVDRLHPDPTGIRLGIWPLEWAVAHGLAEMVNILLQADAGARLHPYEISEIAWTAFKLHDQDILLMLVRSGVCGHTPVHGIWAPIPFLHRAITAGMVDLVSLLLEKGADPQNRSCDGDTALTTAVRVGDIRVILALLGDRPNEPDPWTPANNSESPRGYLRYIDEQDDLGWTPLYIATVSGREDIVRILLARGSRAIWTKTHTDPSPIAFASFYRDVAVGPKNTKPFMNILNLFHNPASATVEEADNEGNSDLPILLQCDKCCWSSSLSDGSYPSKTYIGIARRRCMEFENGHGSKTMQSVDDGVW